MGCWREELWWNPWNSDSLVGANQSKWRTAGITRIRWALHPVTDATDQDWSRAFHLASTSEALCPGSWGDTCMVDVDFQCCSVFPIFSLSVSQFHKYGSYLGGETGRDETWLQLFFSSFRLRPVFGRFVLLLTHPASWFSSRCIPIWTICRRRCHELCLRPPELWSFVDHPVIWRVGIQDILIYIYIYSSGSHSGWWIIVQEICRDAINMFPQKTYRTSTNLWLSGPSIRFLST